jgi:hypothetical protein
VWHDRGPSLIIMVGVLSISYLPSMQCLKLAWTEHCIINGVLIVTGRCATEFWFSSCPAFDFSKYKVYPSKYACIKACPLHAHTLQQGGTSQS